MTSKLFPSLLLSVIIFFFSTCVADDVVPSTTLVAPDTACSACLDPSYCKSMLPGSGSEKHTIYEYSRLSLTQSLESATVFSSIIEEQLKGHSSTPPDPYTEALEDCKLLLGLNIDFLETTCTSMNSTQGLPTLEVDDMLTLLSSILTNHQTCLDGIEATASTNISLYTTLSKGCKMYSVPLGLFNSGWGQKVSRRKGKGKGSSGQKVSKGKWKGKWKGKLGRKLLFSDNPAAGLHGRVPLRITSNLHHQVLESVSSRKLLQASDTVIVRDIVVVNPDGSGNFTTINDAIGAAPNNTILSGGYYFIYVVKGVYEEYVSIAKNKKNIMILGDGINKTVITGNRSVIDGWTTFNSATLAVVGHGFVAVNITVRNTAGAVKHQAVAVRNGADLSTFHSCSFEGYQDTLYTHSNRQFYKECDIYGTIDFIFGNGAVVLQDCNIYARLPMQNQFNAITAQGRIDPSQNTGISIHNCTITAAPDLAASSGTTKTYLGRPWKEYSRTVYMQSFIGSSIDPSGWRAWNGDFALSTLYYAEYSNSGPGSDTSSRVAWPGYHVVGDTDATNFTTSNFIAGDNWLPATGVPFQGSLV